MEQTNREMTFGDFIEKYATKDQVNAPASWMILAEQLEYPFQFNPKQFQFNIGMIAEEFSELIAELCMNEKFSKMIPIDLLDNIKTMADNFKSEKDVSAANDAIKKDTVDPYFDHLGDIAWVCLGAIAALGQYPGDVMSLIVESNFSKVDVNENNMVYMRKDENGKVIKSANYFSPRFDALNHDIYQE